MMTKVKLLIFSILSCSIFTSFAQVKMRDVFAKMPDEVLPFVTTNNRLDCIDFIENGMQARVKNSFDENVELKQLTEDYLLFQTSEVGQMEAKLFAQTDSTAIICVVKTVMGPATDSDVRFYNEKWEPVSQYDALIRRPALDAFFPNVPEEKRGAMDDAKAELNDLMPMAAHLSKQDNTLTWTLVVSELSKGTKKAAQEYVQPVVVRIVLK